MPQTKEAPAAAGANLPAAVPAAAVSVSEVTYSRVGLILPDDISFEEWERIGTTLDTMGAGLNWWRGDWLNKGEAKFGETYAQAVQETGRSEQTLMNVAWVARVFPMERRREALSWSHHAEVAALDPDVADRLLDRAEAENLSKSSLRELVREAKKKIPAATTVPAGDSNLPPAGDLADDHECRAGVDCDCADTDENGDDLVAELEAAAAEIARLEALVEALNTDDKTAALVESTRRYAQLEGRLRQCMAEAAEAKKQATYYGRLLRKAAQLLGVENYGAIPARILGLVQ